MPQESADAPAGWYVDGDEERFWDGSDWTNQRRPVGAGGGPRPVSDEPQGEGIVYKVLTQKDRFFGGKFDPQKLENALNSYAEQGWRIVGVATADIPSFGGGRQELVVVMSRSQ
jgi:hypothetical protein